MGTTDSPAPTPMRLWVLTGVVSLVAAVLGYWGLGEYLGGPPLGGGADFAGAGVADRIYYTLQLFLLDPTPLDAPPYGWQLSVAMYLAPLATILAVLQAISLAFRDRITAWVMRRRTGHAIVIGDGPEAFALARALAVRPGVVLIGSDVRPDTARRHGVRLVTGDPLDRATLLAAGAHGASRVFALSRTGAVNAGVALLVRSVHRGQVSVHARADDGKVVVALRARRLAAESTAGYRLDFFNLEDVAAVALLDVHDRPDDSADGRAPVVIGSGPFVEAIVREVTRRRRRAGLPPSVTVLADDDELSLEPTAGTVYVSADDPDRVLHIGLSLLLRGHPDVVLCLGSRSLLADALEQQLFDRIGARLAVFGVLDAACDPEELRRNTLVERLARALHAHYLAEYAVSGSTQASHRSWEVLDESFRNDNRSQAEHIGVKLAAIGAIIVPAAPELPVFAFREDDPDDEVERLSVMEHDRWMATKVAAGVRYGAQRTPTTHPDVLGWDAGLSEDAKEKDRMFVRGLPALLAAEDLAVVRLPAAGG